MIEDANKRGVELASDSVVDKVLTNIQQKFPVLFFKDSRAVLDCNNLQDIQRAADILAEGGVISLDICGARALVGGAEITSSHSLVNRSIEKILYMKERVQSLIVGASYNTRQYLVDFSRIPPEQLIPNSKSYDIPHFFEWPVYEQILPEGVGMTSELLGKTAAIFWANYYYPFIVLEKMYQSRVSKGFLVGSSANLHGQAVPSSDKAVFSLFRRRGLDLMLINKIAKNDFLFMGRLTMLGFRDGGVINVIRAGSVKARCFHQVYSNLVVDDNFQDLPTAVDINVDLIKQVQSYSRCRLL